MRLLEVFHPEELAVEPCWRPKWTPSGPVVLVEPDEDADIKDPATDTGDGGFKSEQEEEAGLESQVVPAEKIAGAFVVSIVGRSHTRTLHRVGECHRQPGVHYSRFEVLGDEPPEPSKYYRACRNCFGKDAAVVEGSPEDDSSGDVTQWSRKWKPQHERLMALALKGQSCTDQVCGRKCVVPHTGKEWGAQANG